MTSRHFGQVEVLGLNDIRVGYPCVLFEGKRDKLATNVPNGYPRKGFRGLHRNVMCVIMSHGYGEVVICVSGHFFKIVVRLESPLEYLRALQNVILLNVTPHIQQVIQL